MRVDDEITLRPLAPAGLEFLFHWLSQHELGYQLGRNPDSVWSRYFSGRPPKAQWVI